jgi:hypothetical protein
VFSSWQELEFPGAYQELLGADPDPSGEYIAINAQEPEIAET